VSSTDDLARADYSNPERSCDIVMKGGITSGVVYPHAVCDFAKTYRFRNVGGTSAGAIAAAATAAAEYGRAGGGFNKLAALPAWMGAAGNLKSLFQPQRSTRRLFAVLIGALEGGVKKACWVASTRHPLAFLLGAAPGAALFVIGLLHGVNAGFGILPWAAIVAGLLIAPLGSALAVTAHLARQVTHAVPDNKFGICSGGPSPKSSGPAPLTPWLTDMLNDTAGLPKDEPLTFGHLWAGPGNDRGDLPQDSDERFLQLAMMTTNLVNRRAHQLPWDSREWFLDPTEFRQLFTVEVVDWMVNNPPEVPSTYSPAEVRGSRLRRALMLPLLPLPAPPDLPVVVATRMSLSFPVLLSAVPLWGMDMTRPENAVLDEWKRWGARLGDGWDPLAEDIAKWPAVGQPERKPLAERCWFSDGGISSNFPVHFFDRLVPRWPTFAINLRPFPIGEKPDESDQANNTRMVTSNSDGIRDWWYRLPERPGGLGLIDTRIFGFLASAMRTMQNRADEAQMRVPGYRDRVAHVNMSKKEGGMNLTMQPRTIDALTQRGRAAAERLRVAYTPPDAASQKITWDNHRWVRLRSSLAVLEQMHARFAAGYSKAPENEGERPYEQLLGRHRDDPPTSYKWDSAAQMELARREIETIVAVAKLCDPENTVAEGAPRPAPEGRISPRQ
jgi:predicted acylesterase/phospholipase RssA